MSNVVLDDLDKELERGGNTFCRYADDCNIYARSRRAGERVLISITQYLSRKLKLEVNREKSAVDRPWNRKFPGYSMTFNGRQRYASAYPAGLGRRGRTEEVRIREESLPLSRLFVFFVVEKERRGCGAGVTAPGASTE